MPACPGAQASGWWVINESTAYPKFLATDTQLQQFLVMSPITRCDEQRTWTKKKQFFLVLLTSKPNGGTPSIVKLLYPSFEHSDSLMFTMNHLSRPKLSQGSPLQPRCPVRPLQTTEASPSPPFTTKLPLYSAQTWRKCYIQQKYPLHAKLLISPVMVHDLYPKITPKHTNLSSKTLKPNGF